MYRKPIIMAGILVVLSFVLATTALAISKRSCLSCLVEVTGTSTSTGSLEREVGFTAGKGKVNLQTTPNDITGLFKLVGLGNKDLSVVLRATAVTQGKIICTNNGQQLVEAQPRTITLQNSLVINPANFDQNGQVTSNVSITLAQVLSQLKPSMFCPNDNWVVDIVALDDGTPGTLLWQGPADIIHTQQNSSQTEKFVCNQTTLLGAGEVLPCASVQ